MQSKPNVKPNLTLVKSSPLLPPVDVTSLIDMQKDFFDKFDIKVSEALKNTYITLLEEEHEEWIEEYYKMTASEFEELKELTDTLYITLGLSLQCSFKLTKTDTYMVADTYDYAITDIISDIVEGNITSTMLLNLVYAIYSYADAMGWDITEAYRRVHISNMSKLDKDGNAIRREDGKILKGTEYKEAYLEDLTNGK